MDPSAAHRTPVTCRPIPSPDGPLRLDQASCLAERFPGHPCDRCTTACPLGAIDRGRMRGDCLGCGQCAAVCPSSALDLPGFGLPAALPEGSAVVPVDCWRVPAADSPPGAVRVPCLGGIGLGWLVALCDRAGARPVRLLERGLCGSCPVGAGVTGLRERVGAARELLTEAGLAPALLPDLSPARPPAAPWPAIPRPDQALPMGRRGFFRDLLGRGARQLAADAPRSASTLRDRGQPLERLRLVTALANIARGHDRPVPSRVLPRITVTQCQGQGVCARVCPTGALGRMDGAQGAQLRFVATRCIACGQCERSCPEGAIRVAPSGGRAQPELLARWPTRDCGRCGAAFADTGDGCPTCGKRQQLQRDLAALYTRSTISERR